MKIPSLRITQHLADEINWVLDLVVGIRLPAFNDDCCTDHIYCSLYVKLQVFVGFQVHQGWWQ
jgi:hypothetical protein